MDARASIYHYCQYQERCHSEVRNKLYELGCRKTEVEELIAEVIEKNLLNEERFARAYARGKFRMKGWGKQKIIYELRLRKVSDYCIRKGLSEIDEEEYEQAVRKMIEKNWRVKGAKKSRAEVAKIFRYAYQKGYEKEITTAIINELIKEEK
jgi:regulatory protein